MKSAQVTFRTRFELASNVVWYPGHMAKSLRLMSKTHLKRSHAVLEIRDARIPLSSSNPELDKLIGQKKRIVVLNKADLIPHAQRRSIRKAVKAQTNCLDVLFTQANMGENPRTSGIAKLKEFLSENLPSKFKTTPRILLCCGMPNVGKSSIINALRMSSTNLGKVAKVGALPGVTRDITGFAISKEPPIYVLDSPGIMIPNFKDNLIKGLRLGLCSGIPDTVFDPEILSDYLLFWMNTNGNFEYTRYCDPSEITDNFEELLTNVQGFRSNRNKQNMFSKEIDTHNYSVYFLHKFRTGAFGPIVLDSDVLYNSRAQFDAYIDNGTNNV